MSVTTEFTPVYQVTANTADVTAAVQARFVSMTISDEIGINSDQVEIVLDDRDGSIATPAFDALLQISIGYKETGLVNKGQWRVDEVEFEGPERRMVIRGRSADTNAAGTITQLKQKRSQSWVGLTIGQIAGQIAARNSLGLQIDADIAALMPEDDQQNNSDIAYLIYVVHGKKPDAFVKAANGQLIVSRQGTGLSASGLKIPAITITPDMAIRWRCLLTRRASHKKVTARWVDPNGTTQRVTAQSADATDEDSDDEIPEDLPDEDSAADAANAGVNEYARNSEGVAMTLVGIARLCSGTPVTLSGFRQTVDDTWMVSKATHHIDEAGYTTEIDCSKDLSGGDADTES